MIVIVPLNRMPLNPNGKIDKPALPFPDTVQAASVEPRQAGSSQGTSTEETMRSVWASVLPNSPTPIPLDESFFDLGGHSIVATRLIFEIRKTFVVDAPLGLVFDKPTIQDLAAEVDALRNSDLGLAYKGMDTSQGTSGSATGTRATQKQPTVALEYWKDYEALLPKLKDSYPPLPPTFADQPLTVFLTGSTGFLGAFVLRDLLQQYRVKKVICLVRATDVDVGTKRLRELSTDRGVWDNTWIESGRLEVVIGDLSLEHFGLDIEIWLRIADEADTILHNGALVRSPSHSLL